MTRAASKLIGASLLVGAVVWAQEPVARKHVLGIYWDEKSFAANDDFERQFQTALNSEAPGGFEYYSEYLESNRFPGNDQSVALRDYIKRKYAGRPIDVVVANASPALDFLFKY